MSTVPLAVLNRALQALERAREHLNKPTLPDPYVEILRAQSELGYYVNKMMEDTRIAVDAAPIRPESIPEFLAGAV